MKKLQLLVFILFITISTHAQDILWEKNMGGIHADYLYDAVATLDYGFIMVGGSLSSETGDVGKSAGDFDYFITKVSEFGNVEWTKNLGGNKTDVLKKITNTYDGGYLVAGTSNSGKTNDKTDENIGQQDIWLLKLDIKGEISWQKTLGGLANEDVLDVVMTKDGGYLIAGTSASDKFTPKTPNTNSVYKKDDSRGNLDYWLVKLDPAGEEQWQKTIGGQYIDVLRKVIELNDESIILAGASNSPKGHDKTIDSNGLSDWWLLKLDKNGEEIWQESFGEDGDDQLYAMELTQDNNLLLGGNFRTKGKNGKTSSEIKIIKIDLDGEILWEYSYSEGNNTILTDIVKNKDGTFLLSGYVASKKTSLTKQRTKPSKGTEDYLVIKIKADGDESWRKNIGSKQKEVLRKSIKTRDGGYVLMGTSMPFKAGGTNDANFYIVKVRDKDKPEEPRQSLESVPNPTLDYTTVVLGSEYEKGTVRVVDLHGHILQTFEINGERLIPVNLENYSVGMYIINVETDVETNSAKVLRSDKFIKK